MSNAQFATSLDPVSIYFNSTTFKQVQTASLKNASNQVVESVEVLDFQGDDGKVTWVAFFDPGSFLSEQTYSIVWSGIDLNGNAYSFTETGISVAYVDSVYAPLVKFIRQSIMDDGEASDYPPYSFINAIKMAVSKINSYPPFTSLTVETLPFDMVVDYARLELYRSKMARESLEVFNYNDIGKSFALDRASKLQALIGDLDAKVTEKLKVFKINLATRFKGLYSRSASRTTTGVRGKHISQIIYRMYI